MHNVKRSVERVDGVDNVEFDLNTGQGVMSLEPGKTIVPAELWQAVKSSGFTPVKVEIDGRVYQGESQPPSPAGGEP